MKPCDFSMGLGGEPCDICKAYGRVVADRADQLLGLKPDRGLAGLEAAIKAIDEVLEPETKED